jgi:DNA-binding NarL/FixJ family response regulator
VSIRTAIVDDAADIRMLVHLQLDRDSRFAVVGEAGDGIEALALIEQEDPDLVLLDLAMPNMDGLEVLEELHRRRWTRPVVVFSGFASAAMIDRAMALGAAAYLKKGLDIGEIPELLARAFADAGAA